MMRNNFLKFLVAFQIISIGKSTVSFDTSLDAKIKFIEERIQNSYKIGILRAFT